MRSSMIPTCLLHTHLRAERHSFRPAAHISWEPAQTFHHLWTGERLGWSQRSKSRYCILYQSKRCDWMIIQGHCGSSYAFSTVGAIEGAWSLKHGHLVNISAQNIIDCSGAISVSTYSCKCMFSCTAIVVCYMTGHFGNRGCNGGNMKNSFRYVISNKGINSALYYPYRARVRYLWRYEGSYVICVCLCCRNYHVNTIPVILLLISMVVWIWQLEMNHSYRWQWLMWDRYQ